MHSKTQGLLKRKFPLAGLLWIAFAASSCGHHGPDVRLYEVDPSNHGFQCSSRKGCSFMSFADSLLVRPEDKLSCVRPDYLELVIKACKQHQILPVTICELDAGMLSFNCKPVIGDPYTLAVDLADNYACLSDQDFRRMKERCK